MNITNFAKEDADAMNASRKRTVSTLILPCKIGWFGGLFGQGATGSLLGDELCRAILLGLLKNIFGYMLLRTKILAYIQQEIVELQNSQQNNHNGYVRYFYNY
ncbi:hypothetical protein BgiBS90_008844 [Biomphalaria glabrata]|nr:hypothetical protein BgiBS90_008844 [Biomphalaria glabrata]